MPEAAQIETPAAPPPASSAAPPAAASAPDGTAPPAKDEGTLGAGGGGEDTTQTVPANWAANWREILAGGNEKELARLNRYQSPANVWKAYRAMEQKLSSGELLRAKPEGKPDDPAYQTAMNEWRGQLGVPEKPEGYLDKIPSGIVIGDDDKPMIESFLKDMHSVDAPPSYVHKALQWFYNSQETIAEQRLEADRANRATNEDTLRSEWGPEYRPTLNGIRSLFDTHGNRQLLDQLFSARMPDGSPLGDNVDVLKFLANLSREVNPHGVVVPIEGKTAFETVETEWASLNKRMENNKDEYWTNPAMQARWRELDALREKHRRKVG